MSNIYWQATYRDGSYLQQYNADGSENLFKHVKQDELTEFIVVIRDRRYTVSLTTGSFNLNNTVLTFEHLNNTVPRLVYFRRNQIIMPSNVRKTWQCLGIQTTINNINHRVIIKINQDTQELIIETK